MHLITLNDTHTRKHTLGGSPLDEGSARRRDLYLTTHSTHKRQTSIFQVGFKPTTPRSEWPRTYTLERAATGTGRNVTFEVKMK